MTGGDAMGERVYAVAAWQKYAGDFNAMTDSEIEAESQRARDEMEEHESWLEAVASWEAAGKPRREGEADHA